MNRTARLAVIDTVTYLIQEYEENGRLKHFVAPPQFTVESVKSLLEEIAYYKKRVGESK